MSTQPIAAIFSLVTPFRAIADDANCVVIQPGTILPLPSFQVAFGKLTPEVPAIPAVPAVPQQSGPNRPDYIPAQPAIPEVPAVPAMFSRHRTEDITLTKEEWDAWDDSISDNSYILSVVAKRFGIPLSS